jgi:RNA polymerase sigma factor (sigma-70 family)
VNAEMDRVRQEPIDVFHQQVLSHIGLIRHIGKSALHGQHDLDDFTHTVIVAALASRERLRPASHIKAWIAGIAHNTARHWNRKREPAFAADLPEGTFPVPPVDELIEENERRQRVIEALSTLGPDERDLLRSYYLDGLSHDELEQRHLVSHAALRMRLTRARRSLRRHVGVTVASRGQATAKGIAMTEVGIQELRRFKTGVPVGIFDGLDDEQLGKVARITRRRPFATGEELIRGGAGGDEMYLLLSGAVRVTKVLDHTSGGRLSARDKVIIDLPAEWNPYYGELALFDANAPRTATIAGSEAGEHGVLNTRDFQSLADEDQAIGYCVLKNVLRKQVASIRKADENILNLLVAVGRVASSGGASAASAHLVGGDPYIGEFLAETLSCVPPGS